MSSVPAIDPDWKPGVSALYPDAGPDSHDRKTTPAPELYPGLDRYQRLDTARYYSKEYMDLEWSRMWTRVWTCAGRADDLRQPGSWFTYELGRESFIIVRERDNSIKAFYNVCQHRGRRLVDAESGVSARFACPFHSWTYGLDGKNIKVTDRELFGEKALCGDLNLKSVRCETWAGFVFINMDPKAPPLMEFLDELPALMSSYRMEDMHVVKEVVVPFDCNWKTGLDAFNEAYHLHITHPEAVPVTDDVYLQFDIFRNGHARQCSPLGIPSPRMDDRVKVHPMLAMVLADAGVDPETFKGNAMDVRGAIQRAKRQPDNRFGLDYSRYTDSQLSDDWNYIVWPNMTFNAHPEGVLVMRFLPHASHPEKFYYHMMVIVPRMKEGGQAPFYMGVDPGTDLSGKTRPPRVHSQPDNPAIGWLLTQDISNFHAAQLGTHSRGLPGGLRLAQEEERLQVFHYELDEYVEGRK